MSLLLNQRVKILKVLPNDSTRIADESSLLIMDIVVQLEDGEVPIDNNASERAIRGFCIGKKNWQMIDSINGAKASAIIYSIAQTAKANNIKPYDYFEHILNEMPKHMDDSDRSFLEDLLPWSEKLQEGIRKK